MNRILAVTALGAIPGLSPFATAVTEGPALFTSSGAISQAKLSTLLVG